MLEVEIIYVYNVKHITCTCITWTYV